MRIYADSRRYQKYAAICAGAGLLGIVVARSTWLGIPVAVVFGALTLFLVRGALARAPQITLDEHGIGGAELPRPLAWGEIASIEHFTRSGRYSAIHFLRITPLGGKPFEVSLAALTQPPELIVALVAHYHAVE